MAHWNMKKKDGAQCPSSTETFPVAGQVNDWNNGMWQQPEVREH